MSTPEERARLRAIAESKRWSLRDLPDTAKIVAAVPGLLDELEAVERRYAELDQQEPSIGFHPTLVTFKSRAADALADEVAVLVRRNVIDSRSPAGDALLDYRNPPSTERADRMARLEQQLAHAEATILGVKERLNQSKLRRALPLGSGPYPAPSPIAPDAATWDAWLVVGRLGHFDCCCRRRDAGDCYRARYGEVRIDDAMDFRPDVEDECECGCHDARPEEDQL